ncbi:MAG: PAS domain-containing sensor histidine kinase [Bdellovibrionales bacterium]|nr:PAS domain-containing sensor histidine kinase [Bdellovibrionales bacterium]
MKYDNYFEQLLQALNSSAIVGITDNKGKIIFANEKFCEASGYSMPELLGRDHRILNSGLHPKEFFQNMWTTVQSGKTWTGEIQNKKKNGELYWVQSTIAPIFDEKGEIINFVAIRFDITQMKKAQVNLIESNRMASLGEMASGIAHEINNPLTIILGRLAIMKKKIDKKEDTEVLKNEVALVEKTVFRISNIVNGLRKLSRDNTKDPIEVFSIKKIIEETKELFTQKLKNKEIQFEIVDENEFDIKGKSLQLSQVIVNLINNSIDAIETLENKWIKIVITQKDSHCLIQVIDSGKGIPKEVASKLMTPFYTTKGPGKGTGLGLSLSKKMIEEADGNFYFDQSQPHTTFCIELPMAIQSNIDAA